jgi:hypothetical protein
MNIESAERSEMSSFLQKCHKEDPMTIKQKAAARRNIKKAGTAAKRARTIAHLPKQTRTALGKQGAKTAHKKTRDVG